LTSRLAKSCPAYCCCWCTQMWRSVPGHWSELRTPEHSLPQIALVAVALTARDLSGAFVRIQSMSNRMGAVATCVELTAALPVFEHVMRVLEFSMFADAAATESSGQHGWCRYSRQSFWSGLYLLLRSVDVQPFSQLLVHFPYLVTLVRGPRLVLQCAANCAQTWFIIVAACSRGRWNFADSESRRSFTSARTGNPLPENLV
jgi:hypothetical protein